MVESGIPTIVADSGMKDVVSISTERPTRKPAVLATGIETGWSSAWDAVSAVSVVVGPDEFWFVRLALDSKTITEPSGVGIAARLVSGSPASAWASRLSLGTPLFSCAMNVVLPVPVSKT